MSSGGQGQGVTEKILFKGEVCENEQNCGKGGKV